MVNPRFSDGPLVLDVSNIFTNGLPGSLGQCLQPFAHGLIARGGSIKNCREFSDRRHELSVPYEVLLWFRKCPHLCPSVTALLSLSAFAMRVVRSVFPAPTLGRNQRPKQIRQNVFRLASIGWSNCSIAASVKGSVARPAANSGRTVTAWAPQAMKRDSASIGDAMKPRFRRLRRAAECAPAQNACHTWQT